MNISAYLPRQRLLTVLVATFFVTAGPALADDDASATGIDSAVELSLSFENLDYQFRSVRLLSANLTVESEFRLPGSFFGYADVVVSVESLMQRPGPALDTEFVEVEELWFAWRSAQLSEHVFWAGRYAVADSTAWWWDGSFVGLGWQFGNFEERDDPALLVAVTHSTNEWSTEDQVRDPEEDSIAVVLGTFVLPLSQQESISTFIDHQMDLSKGYSVGEVVSESRFDDIDADITRAGFRYESTHVRDSVGTFSLLFDAAYMKGTQNRTVLVGEEDDEDNPETEEGDSTESGTTDLAVPKNETSGDTIRESLSGWAANLVLGWSPAFSENTRFSLGYAFGSGTAKEQPGGSQTFRQTGFQENEAGTAYYGLLFEPELANLRIATALLSHRFGAERTGYLQYNHYRRASRYDDTLESDLDVEVVNDSVDVGSEVALGMSLLLDFGVTMDVAMARFSPGESLGKGLEAIDYYEISLAYEF